MENFPSNNKHSPRVRDEPEEQKKVSRVVQGGVVQRKTPLSRRLSRSLIGGDTQTVWSYVVGEVLIPAGQDMFLDAIRGGFERLILGDGARSHSRSRGRSPIVGHTDYRSISSGRRPGRESPRREVSHRGRATHDFGEIVLETRVEAEEVLDQMDHLIDKYDVATVADLYELCGVSGNYTDNKWGWSDLRTARVSHVRGGYLLELPKPEPIE